MMKELNENAILKEAMAERGATQTALAKKLGMSQNNLSGIVNRVRPSVSAFKDVLDKLEYDVVIVDRRTGELVWKIEQLQK